VAILERLEPSMTALAKALERQPIMVPHLDVTTGDSYPEHRSFHEANFALEHELYAHCLELNARLIVFYRWPPPGLRGRFEFRH